MAKGDVGYDAPRVVVIPDRQRYVVQCANGSPLRSSSDGQDRRAV